MKSVLIAAYKRRRTQQLFLAVFALLVFVIGHQAHAIKPANNQAYQEPSFCMDQAIKPSINIDIVEVPVRFDMTKAVEDLGRMKQTLPSRFAGDVDVITGGMMSGDIKLAHALSFKKSPQNPKCFAIEQIDITLSMTSKIYVAQDFQKRPCLFKEIFAHEAKHIDVDRDVLQKHSDRIMSGLHLLWERPQDYIFLAPRSLHVPARNMIRDDVAEALKALFIHMMQDRNYAQSKVDTIEEYARISDACPQEGF
jgi:hypothetical protein